MAAEAPRAPRPAPAGQASGGSSSSSGELGSQPLLQVLASLLRELPGVLSDRIQLLSLELRRAGLALAQIIALVVLTGVLVVTAWIALWLAAALLLLDAGLPLGGVLLVVLIVNLGAAALAAQRVRGLIPLLGLPATVRRLTLATPAVPPAPAASPAPPRGPDAAAGGPA